LQIGQAIHVNELKLPEGAVAVTPGAIVIAQVVAQSGAEATAAIATSSEPELIRKEKSAEAGA
jgi:hypothetical protein